MENPKEGIISPWHITKMAKVKDKRESQRQQKQSGELHTKKEKKKSGDFSVKAL